LLDVTVQSEISSLPITPPDFIFRGYGDNSPLYQKYEIHVIDEYQHMHFFTFNTVLVHNVDFKVKIQ